MMLHEREKAVLETLEKIPRQHVVLVGGYAVNVYVPPRFSVDCDLVVLEGLPRLEAALSKEGFVRTGRGDVPGGSYIRFVREKEDVSFDLLVSSVVDRATGIGFEAELFEKYAKNRTTVGRVNSIRIDLTVADPELLFAMKFVSGRRQDVRDLFMLSGERLDWGVVETLLRTKCTLDLIRIRAAAIGGSIGASQYRPSLQGAFGKIPDDRFEACKGRLAGFLEEIVGNGPRAG
jgi:hypothetical protein